MSTNIYDGKALLAKFTRQVKRETQRLRRQYHLDVGLGILLITGDQISMADSGKIVQVAEQAGIRVEIERIAKRNVARKFYPTLEEYASSPFIQGIYIQLPLPTDVVPLREVMKRLPPEKDVAGLHFINRGMSTYPPQEVSRNVKPPEVMSIIETLKASGFDFHRGKIVLVGSNATSSMVKILAGYLFDEGCNVRLLRYANISQDSQGSRIRHLDMESEQTSDITEIINPDNEAVITWANHAGWLTKSRLMPRSIVIDMGYKFSRGRVSGDCEFLSVSQTASFLTPVPGGVRTITHVMILNNLIDLIREQRLKEAEDHGRDLKRKFPMRQKSTEQPN